MLLGDCNLQGHLSLEGWSPDTETVDTTHPVSSDHSALTSHHCQCWVELCDSVPCVSPSLLDARAGFLRDYWRVSHVLLMTAAMLHILQNEFPCRYWSRIVTSDTRVDCFNYFVLWCTLYAGYSVHHRLDVHCMPHGHQGLDVPSDYINYSRTSDTSDQGRGQPMTPAYC